LFKVCTVEGCDGKAQSRGWCGKHYARWLRHGDTDSRRRRAYIADELVAALIGAALVYLVPNTTKK